MTYRYSSQNSEMNMETSIKGLYLLEEIISPEEEKYFIEQIQKGVWSTGRSGRRVQISGAKHNIKYETISGKVTPHPKYIKKLIKILKEICDLDEGISHLLTRETIQKISSPETSEIFINEYNKGDSLYPHFDQRKTYRECIFGISLASDVIMTFGSRDILIPARSLYIMSGDSRYRHKHSIKHVDSYRLSVTFRTLF